MIITNNTVILVTFSSGVTCFARGQGFHQVIILFFARKGISIIGYITNLTLLFIKLDQEKPVLKETKVSAQIDRRLTRHVKVCTKLDVCMPTDFMKRHEVYSHSSP